MGVARKPILVYARSRIDMRCTVMLALVVLLLLCCGGRGLRLMSFNVRQFGQTKFANEQVVSHLVQIFRQYDVGILIELQDVQMTVLPQFVARINNVTTVDNQVYRYNVSERVGRSKQKEQYVFIYREKSVEIIDSYQYPDVDDQFERPPYTVLLRCMLDQCGDLPQFFITVSHTRPSDAVAEINALLPVFNAAASQFHTSYGMIMGDLNADCTYVSKTAFNTLLLFNNTNFTWWIGSENDTTTSNTTDCAYDRIITHDDFTTFVVPGSVDVVRFDIQLGLTQEQTRAVSDHYPVQVTVRAEAAATTRTTTTRTTTTRTTTTTIMTPSGTSGGGAVTSSSGLLILVLGLCVQTLSISSL